MSRIPRRIVIGLCVVMWLTTNPRSSGSIEVGPPGPESVTVPVARSVVWEACLRVRQRVQGTIIARDEVAGILVFGVADGDSPERDDIAYYSVLIDSAPEVAGAVVHVRVHSLAGGDSKGRAQVFFEELMERLEHESER